MKHMIVSILLSLLFAACDTASSSSPSTQEPTTPADCKPLKSLWHSKTDNETHDLRNLNFTFLYAPYSYVGSDNFTCNQTMRWYMFTPDINGASFEMEFQNNNPSNGCDDWQMNGSVTQARLYIVNQCTTIKLCNESFSSCKIFE